MRTISQESLSSRFVSRYHGEAGRILDWILASLTGSLQFRGTRRPQTLFVTDQRASVSAISISTRLPGRLTWSCDEQLTLVPQENPSDQEQGEVSVLISWLPLPFSRSTVDHASMRFDCELRC